jgi:hypothetical protein
MDRAMDRPQASKNPSSRGREEGKEDEGDALPARRRCRAQTFDGKGLPSPRAAPS